MATKVDPIELLQKAKAKSLSAHFKKAAAHHDAMADHHEKCMKAHDGAAEHHEGMASKGMEEAEKSGDATDLQKADAHKAHHKAKAAFHKTMSTQHEKMHKRHSAHADHNRMMAEAHSEGEGAAKALKSLGIEEEVPVMAKNDPTPTPVTPTPVTPTQVDPNNPAGAVMADLNAVIQKALDAKLTEGVAAALERVLASDDFNKKVDNQIAGMLLEKLGTSTVPTEVKTFPVPRDNGRQTVFTPVNKQNTPTPINMEGVDLELQDMCKMD